MKTVMEYAISKTQEVLRLKVPIGSTILGCGCNNGAYACLWVLADYDETEHENRFFIAFPNNMEIPDDPGSYIGTALVSYLFPIHVFETTGETNEDPTGQS